MSPKCSWDTIANEEQHSPLAKRQPPTRRGRQPVGNRPARRTSPRRAGGGYLESYFKSTTDLERVKIGMAIGVTTDAR